MESIEMQDGTMEDLFNSSPDNSSKLTGVDMFDDNQQEIVQETTLSPIEEAFRTLGYENGIIKYEDEEVHIDALTPEEQLDILAQAIESTSFNNQFTEDELTWVEMARNNNLSLTQLLEQTINEQVQETLSQYNLNQFQAAQDLDINTLTPEQLIYQDVINKLGDVSEEEIATEYELEIDRINSSAHKDKIINSLRNKLQQEQERYIQEQSFIQNEQIERQLEEQRTVIVNKIAAIDTIAGIKVDDDSKNEILSLMLEPHSESEEGLPILIEEYWRQPEIAYEAEYSRRALPNVINYYENQIKELRNEMAKMKSTVRKEILDGFPSQTTKVTQSKNIQNRNRTEELSVGGLFDY